MANDGKWKEEHIPESNKAWQVEEWEACLYD